MSTAEVGSIWRHVRRGTTYIVIAEATGQDSDGHDHWEGTPVVVYMNLEAPPKPKVYVRRFAEFMDGRFIHEGNDPLLATEMAGVYFRSLQRNAWNMAERKL